MVRKEKLVIGLSGGPASAIAAALLRNQNFDLLAVHFRVNPEVVPASHCMPLRNEKALQTLCDKLSIPLVIEELTGEVQGRLLAPLIESRLSGRTPDSCLIFHSEILLPRLWEIAQRSRAQQIATGHHAQVVLDRETQRPLLQTSIDQSSDQSALLARCPQEILGRLQLPLSGIPSALMNRVASELGLSGSVREGTLGNPWSPACFPEATFTPQFCTRYLSLEFQKGGLVRSVEDYTTSEHEGLAGLRIGFPAPGIQKQVVLRFAQPNQGVFAGSEERLTLKQWQLHSLSLFRWPGDPFRALPISCRIAGNASSFEGMLERYEAGLATLNFESGRLHPTPGQAIVFYDRNEVIGSALLGDPIFPNESSVQGEPRSARTASP